jgi:hypothetical protein
VSDIILVTYKISERMADTYESYCYSALYSGSPCFKYGPGIVYRDWGFHDYLEADAGMVLQITLW